MTATALSVSLTPPESFAANASEAELRAAFSARPLHKVQNFSPYTMAADCTTAVAVAMTAAIPISIIDYSIMARVAGVTDSSLKELFRGIRTVLLRPHKFFLPCKENKCALVYAVCATTYGFTYMGSNMAKSYLESTDRENIANLTAGILSGAINTVLTIWKDSVILRALPPVNANDLASAKKPVPNLTRFLFGCRDVLTCVAAFTIAPALAVYLSQYIYHHRRVKGVKDAALPEDEGKRKFFLSPADTAQIITPALLQFVTTLMHITAIRYRQTYPQFNWADLKKSLHDTYLSSTLLRICRIIPAFGLGGILNREMRCELLNKAEPEAIPKAK